MSDPLPLGLTELAMHTGGTAGHAPRILKVLRYTATQVICENPGTNGEYRFRISDGRKVGSDSYSIRVKLVTDETRTSIRRHALDLAIRQLGYAIEELVRKIAHMDRRTADVNALLMCKATLSDIRLKLDALFMEHNT